MTTVHDGEPGAVTTTAPRPRRAHPLLVFLAKRLAITAGLLLGVTVVTFGLVNVVPGDPVTANLSDQALNDPATVAPSARSGGWTSRCGSSTCTTWAIWSAATWASPSRPAGRSWTTWSGTCRRRWNWPSPPWCWRC
ncbi:hypothetical protein [Verrucosispora sioxanthis]|uniref:hypothetical protein n=1 Tax=Verrucosispora sioxanthis TaxID=2499994 RepID=UPI001C0F8BB7|nr:hypothetical protein [Verrucosispora sioxanthis]